MHSDIAIATDQISKIFSGLWTRREVRAVDGVTLQVARGTTFGLLGPNGAGKTTFVKMLLASIRPTSGTSRLFGLDSRERKARIPVGYLPENHRFPRYYTGAGMLDLYGALSGLDWRARKRRIPELLALVGLERWGDVRLGKYSKGMLQRVGLAQALLHEPPLLILDEPTDGVDPIGRKHIREILRSLEERGVTIFINSHLLGEVELFCREVAIFHNGKIALIGKVADLTRAKGYRLLAGQVPEALVGELATLGAVATGENGSFEMRFHDRETANQAIDRLRQALCPIESLAPATSTLEEIFLRTIHGQ